MSDFDFVKLLGQDYGLVKVLEEVVFLNMEFPVHLVDYQLGVHPAQVPSGSHVPC